MSGADLQVPSSCEVYMKARWLLKQVSVVDTACAVYNALSLTLKAPIVGLSSVSSGRVGPNGHD